MKHNTILTLDGYKYSHTKQYRPDTSFLESHFLARSGKYTHQMLVGLQIYLHDLAENPITKEDLEEAIDLCGPYGAPLDVAQWQRIIDVHGGHLPLEVLAVPEGTLVPVGVPMFKVRSKDKLAAWTSSAIETYFAKVWYPSYVATMAHYIKRDIKQAIIETSDVPWQELIGFMLNDFGLRGVSSAQSGGIGGLGHLSSFLGSDNTESLRYARKYYGAKGFIAATIPAMEHSTVTSWGLENEEEAYRNMLNEFAKPGAIVACVSDSRDIFYAIEHYWCGSLLKQVQESGARIVIRPDSGDPVAVLLRCLEILGRKVGFTVNSKGYKVLPTYFRLIQGDGVDDQSIKNILYNLKLAGWSVENVVFGMGGALLQKMDRDSMSNAYKCSLTKNDKGIIPVHKAPVTSASKVSKGGDLDTVKIGTELFCVDRLLPGNSGYTSELQMVYDCGAMPNKQLLADLRSKADSYL